LRLCRNLVTNPNLYKEVNVTEQMMEVDVEAVDFGALRDPEDGLPLPFEEQHDLAKGSPAGDGKYEPGDRERITQL
jgi:hypothetical protein